MGTRVALVMGAKKIAGLRGEQRRSGRWGNKTIVKGGRGHWSALAEAEKGGNQSFQVPQ